MSSLGMVREIASPTAARLRAVTSTYADVDAGEDPADAIRWQERVDGWPQIRAYKRRVVERLAGARSVIDVGCGPGVDVLELGTRRCLGVDLSMAMCSAALRRGAIVARADAGSLPFADRTFDGAHADRVLQHVSDPMRVLGEMARVLRRDGRLVIADPDQETLVIHVPEVAPELVGRVKTLRRDVGYRNGRLASSWPARLAAMGMVDVAVDAFVLLLTDPDDAFGIAGWPRLWQASGGFSPEEIDHWEQAVGSARQGGFLYSLIYFVVVGTVP
jgi:SAM-dependent methyltransferase